MKINIIPHARRRMRERNISPEDIERAIKFPDKLERDRNHHHRLLVKKIISVYNKPGLLLVVLEQNPQGITVVTVITTSKILKYL